MTSGTKLFSQVYSLSQECSHRRTWLATTSVVKVQPNWWTTVLLIVLEFAECQAHGWVWLLPFWKVYRPCQVVFCNNSTIWSWSSLLTTNFGISSWISSEMSGSFAKVVLCQVSLRNQHTSCFPLFVCPFWCKVSWSCYFQARSFTFRLVESCRKRLSVHRNRQNLPGVCK